MGMTMMGPVAEEIELVGSDYNSEDVSGVLGIVAVFTSMNRE